MRTEAVMDLGSLQALKLFGNCFHHELALTYLQIDGGFLGALPDGGRNLNIGAQDRIVISRVCYCGLPACYVGYVIHVSRLQQRCAVVQAQFCGVGLSDRD